LKSKILSSNIVTLILIVSVTVFTSSKYASIVNKYKFIAEVNIPNVLAQSHMGLAVEKIHADINLLLGTDNTKDQAIKAKALILNSIDDFKKAQKIYEDLPFVYGESEVWDDYKNNFWIKYQESALKIIDLSLSGDSADRKKRDEFGANAWKELYELGNQKFEDLLSFQSKEVHNAVKDGQSVVDLMTWVVPLSVTSISIFSLVVAYFIASNVAYFFNQVAKNIQQTSDQVANAAENVSESSNALSQSTTEQAASLEQTASAIEELTSMVKKNSENANETSKISEASQNKAQEGQQVVEQMIQSMNDINESNSKIQDQINHSNLQMTEIVKIIEEIGTKTKVINDIVFQTKLLSFNASVEAARAGEYGKGFAVVAEEVGNLAQMSGKAALEISSMLDSSRLKVTSIVQDTQSKVSILISEGKNKIDNGTEIARQCGDVLNEIVNQVTHVSQMAGEISTASQEQSTGLGEINKAVGQLDQVTQQNASTSETVATAAEQLNRQSEIMRDTVESLLQTLNGVNSNVMLNKKVVTKIKHLDNNSDTSIKNVVRYQKKNSLVGNLSPSDGEASLKHVDSQPKSNGAAEFRATSSIPSSNLPKHNDPRFG